MTDPVKLLQAKKAALLAKAEAALVKAEKAVVEANNEAAEMDEDIEDLVRLKAIADKYGIELVERERADDQEGNVEPQPNALQNASMYVRAKVEGEAIIRAAGKPLPLSVIYDALIHRGIVLGGKTPKNTLSAYLGQNPNLRSTPHGWWLASQPLPNSLNALLTDARVLLKGA
jgi:hypothetical protein